MEKLAVMQSLKNSNSLKASSLVESVIAIAIISVCVLVAFMIYINVIRQNDPISYFNAKHKVESLIQEITEKKNYENDSYTFSNYSITKNVIINTQEQTAMLEFKIKTAYKTYTVNRLIPYVHE